MEAQLTKDLPVGEHWQYEPEWDGFRCLAFCENGSIDLRSKNGRPLKSNMTISQTGAFATVQRSSAGVPTKTQELALSTNSTSLLLDAAG